MFQRHLFFQFWSAFVPCKTKWKDSVRQTLDQIDTVKKFVRRYPDTFQFATSADGNTYFGQFEIIIIVNIAYKHIKAISVSYMHMANAVWLHLLFTD